MPVAADVLDADSLRDALSGHDAAYYLVHSLADADFAAKDRPGARHLPTPRAMPGWLVDVSTTASATVAA